jgi:hypothetical protein
MARVIIPFDDSLQKNRRRSTTNSSTSTSVIDAYRQGVELTKPSDFALGIAKIHDGYNDQTGQHGVSQFIYGQERPILRDHSSYLDTSKFSPLSVFQEGSGTFDGNSLQLEDIASIDGTIEPLQIRKVVNLLTHPKDVSHKIWAALDEGNVNDRASSEIFITSAAFNDIHVGSFPFVDESDVVHTLPLHSETISPDNRKNGSFLDSQEHNGIIISTLTMENDIISALRAMRPPTVNSLPSTHIQLGSTGFD